MIYQGFDADEFPGLAKLNTLKLVTNLTFCGFYLAPAPSHQDDGWMSQRAALVKQGWGLLPVYVGQQLQGPGRRNVTDRQGMIDGVEAASLMTVAGFPINSYVYLDLENGPPFTPAEAEYVKAWAACVVNKGYNPGIYCSHDFAADVAALVPKARMWVVRTATTSKHLVLDHLFNGRAPADSGYEAATICQCDQNAELVVSSLGLLVDLNTSTIADPSAAS